MSVIQNKISFSSDLNKMWENLWNVFKDFATVVAFYGNYYNPTLNRTVGGSEYQGGGSSNVNGHNLSPG